MHRADKHRGGVLQGMKGVGCRSSHTRSSHVVLLSCGAVSVPWRTPSRLLLTHGIICAMVLVLVGLSPVRLFIARGWEGWK